MEAAYEIHTRLLSAHWVGQKIKWQHHDVDKRLKGLGWLLSLCRRLRCRSRQLPCRRLNPKPNKGLISLFDGGGCLWRLFDPLKPGLVMPARELDSAGPRDDHSGFGPGRI
jgi:hypothetical protein